MEHPRNDYGNYIDLNRSMSGQYELPIIHEQKNIPERNEIEIEMHSTGQQLEGDEYESISEMTGTHNVTNVDNDKIHDNNIGECKIVCFF